MIMNILYAKFNIYNADGAEHAFNNTTHRHE